MNSFSSDRATHASFERLLAAVPQLEGCAALGSFVALPDKTLLHAGPPFHKGEAIPAPVLNSAAAAAQFEGWAGDFTAARRAITSGDIRLAPAQDHAVVTPLAFVVSPSMPALCVSDAAGHVSPRYTPVNDGPPPGALRFGARHEGQFARLALLARIGQALGDALRDAVPVLPIMKAGLVGGDDLHGRVSAANSALADVLAPRLSGEADDYLSLANQFVLNVIMAACAVMIAAGDGVEGSRLVTATGGNGIRFGWQLASACGIWQTAAAAAPVGPHFPHTTGRRFLPAIGDSAVIDACGFGAAALRHAPVMIAVLRGHVPESYFDATASTAFIGSHPAFPLDLKLGLDIDATGPARGVMLAAVDADGEAGLVGRGISPWPTGR
ncbi:hypothetical protein ASD45_11945 [Pseudolabrys sp. Root1462]|uniref:oxamate carbamoyltransferase subunit AllG family protein n=1 Tax=Pseudolabrys sp. Root1462 TaxID=1736466 RepID=UPI000702FB5D|nr:DUF1116 domain-containing protein [Pseudolabrys sp. Root1462]KQZ01482.1 hypothetical protein ASD45_11945 [Pseudolabrys sp. Root1462]